MKKPFMNVASTDVKFRTNNLKLFIKKDEKDSFLKLSLPLMITFWFPFMLSLSTIGLNHGNEGNVNVFDRNLTNTNACPYLEDQSQNHTDRVLLEFNLSRVHNDSFEEIEANPLHETSPMEELVWKVLGYSTLVCETQFPDPYFKTKQEEVHTGRTHLTHSITNQDNGLTGALSGLANITHRLEPDGTEYNYASASKGAKVVAHNKEAKGANNILSEDHNMYLRNPSSVLEKFVIIELAQETLVDALTIANFEHHSSNFKQFDLYGSLVFPAEKWYPIGNFVAENVKHSQYFKLTEPKWARYVKLRLISHYGSEFYCTLSVFEVYGVDAIEKMLEDLIVTSEEPSNSTAASVLGQVSGSKRTDNEFKNVIEGLNKNNEGVDDDDDALKKPLMVTKVLDVAKGNGRIHGDAVLKILMQKVGLLDKNLFLLEDYIKEMNMRQSEVFYGLDQEILKYAGLVEETRFEIKNLLPWKDTMEKKIADMDKWKASVSFLLESIVKENVMLRHDIEKIASDEERLDKAEHVLFASLSFTIVAAVKILSDRFLNFSSDKRSRRGDRGWRLVVFTCFITAIVTLTFC